MYEYKYPMPAVTADVIVFRRTKDQIEVLLVQRNQEPFKNHWSIVGGHLDVLTDPTVLDCAVRELKEETNITVKKEHLYFVEWRDKIDRDPRGRYITFVFAARCPDNANIVAQDDVKDYQWLNLKSLLENQTPLAFDHKEILEHWGLPQLAVNGDELEQRWA